MVSSLKYLFLVMVLPASGVFLRASDDSGPVGDVISKTMGDIQIAMVPDTSKFEDASELIRGMATARAGR